MIPLPPPRELGSRAARHRNKIELVANPQALSGTLHTEGFIQRWTAMLVELYGYREKEGLLLVPGLTGGTTAVHVPLLSYSALSLDQASSVADKLQGQAKYQIRVLEGGMDAFKANETVTMRLDLSCGSAEQLFNGVIPSKCRGVVRKSYRAGLEIRHSTGTDLVEDFYQVFATAMHRHGTPVFPKRLFSLLPQFVETHYLVGYKDGVPVSVLCLVMDEDIALVPWAGSLIEFRSLCPNHRLYWNAIRLALEAGKAVFDFGRSGYQAPTYVFKEEWGAAPVRLVTLSSERSDVYSKYSLASSVWKRLPRPVVNTIGPQLCRFLPDL